jgi:hypothetical protein
MGKDKFIEDQISQAVARGKFDNLPGKGRPLDLDAYFSTPEDLRLCYSILKNGDFVPEEVQLLKDVEALKTRLANCSSDAERARIEKAVTEKMLGFNLLMDKRKGNRR